MSVQLIIAPQSSGTAATTTTTGGGTEFIVDGNNFTFLNTATSVEGVTDWNVFGNGLYALTVNPPTSPNTWYRYRNVSPTHSPNYQPYPTQSSGNVTFTTLGTADAGYPTYENNWSAIYQTMTGLTVGQVYLVRIKNNCVITEQSRAAVSMAYYTGGSPYPYLALSNFQPPTSSGYDWINCTPTIGPPCVLNGNDILFEFTATHTELVFYLSMAAELNTVTTATITDISVTDVPTTTTTTATGFLADELHGQQILDLYEDETIPLTLSVDDFKDVATKTQSYSKAFHLPATKKNNRIFGNLFEITKASGLYTFNPYKKTSVMLKENGFIVFEGFLKLIDIVDKKGEISYNVNLYSDSVALMDSMKDLTFADLNLSELDHDYNLTSIQASQTGALPLLNALQADSFAGAAGDTTTSVLKYPFLNWAGSIRRNATSAQVSDGATSGRPSLKRLEDGFRPFINVKYLVDNIFKDAGFTYSSAFFDSSYFSNLYMDFNWGEEPDGAAPLRNDFIKRKSTIGTATAVGQTFTNVPVNVDNGGNTDLWNNTGYYFQSDVNNLHCTGTYRIQVINTATVNKWSAEMRICVFNSSGSVIETIEQYKWVDVNPGGSGDIQGSFDVALNNGDYIQMEAKDFSSSAKIYISDTTTSFLNITYNNNAVQVPTLLNTARGEMVQWDFLKGLFTMFNLITLQDKQNPSNILIEPYNDVFSDNVTTLDWTQKVDVSDIKLKPLDLKKRVVFKYEEDEEDYPFRVYKTATGGFLYGSLTLDSEQLDLLSGEDEVIASPFAATIMKDLFDDTPELTAPSIYGSNEEVTEFGSIKNLPRILYDTGVYVASDTFYVPSQNGVSSDNKDHYSLFSHTSVVPAAATDNDLNFGACQLINQSMGVSPVNNLYSTYYARYFQELYSPDVKSMTLKVLLTPNDIANFNFYDKIFIKNREYRVDKINYKPNDLSTVDFILIT